MPATDRVRHADPEIGLLILILLYTGGLMATAVLGGIASHRSGRSLKQAKPTGTAFCTPANQFCQCSRAASSPSNFSPVR